ncbi:MAG: DNA-binding protein [Oscillospiraceae bacterium]|nr:DNA-binding protein [Oscillospiraceae bacterium]MBR4101223.1 DNA-binding protein [Oscillospiraceae bacterium]
MAKNLSIVLLLDCYGELLTERQRDVAELYFNEDLSLTEIAEARGITRQAVRDSIRHSEQALLEMEEKLGMAERITGMRECLGSILRHCGQENGEEPLDEIAQLARKGLLLL